MDPDNQLYIPSNAGLNNHLCWMKPTILVAPCEPSPTRRRRFSCTKHLQRLIVWSHPASQANHRQLPRWRSPGCGGLGWGFKKNDNPSSKRKPNISSWHRPISRWSKTFCRWFFSPMAAAEVKKAIVKSMENSSITFEEAKKRTWLWFLLVKCPTCPLMIVRFCYFLMVKLPLKNKSERSTIDRCNFRAF